MEMGEILKKLRKEKNLKQQDVADMLNVVHSAVSKYELGKGFPEYDTLLKLAEFYDVNLDYLFGRTKIRTSMRRFEEKLETNGDSFPVDVFFTLSEADKKAIKTLICSLANQETKA